MDHKDYIKLRDELFNDLEDHIRQERKNRKNIVFAGLLITGSLGIGLWGFIQEVTKNAVENSVHGQAAEKAKKETLEITNNYVTSKQILKNFEQDYSSMLEKVASLEAKEKNIVSNITKKLKLDEKFLASLKGMDGTNGINGTNGKNGINGKNGLPGFGKIIASGSNWCAELGENYQSCWGYEDLSTTNTHTRDFSFKFSSPFSAAPIVTNAINANSTGWAFSIYKSTVNNTKYSGRIVEHTSRKNMTPVRMNYFAIGLK